MPGHQGHGNNTSPHFGGQGAVCHGVAKQDPKWHRARALTQGCFLQVALQFSFAMKCADLGHCIRPAQLHIRWTKAVTSEFYTQVHWL